jgi:hypothetical protein
MLNDNEELGLKDGSVLDNEPLVGSDGGCKPVPMFGRLGAGVSSSESVRSMTSDCRF